MPQARFIPDAEFAPASIGTRVRVATLLSAVAALPVLDIPELLCPEKAVIAVSMDTQPKAAELVVFETTAAIKTLVAADAEQF